MFGLITRCLLSTVLLNLASSGSLENTETECLEDSGESTQTLLQTKEHSLEKTRIARERFSPEDIQTIQSHFQKQFAGHGPRQVPALMLQGKQSAARSEIQVIRVTVISAQNLPDTDRYWYGNSDPYVEVGLRGHSDTKFVTDTKQDTHHPTWNVAREVGDFQPGDTLTFRIWDEDWTSRDFMGDAFYAPNCGIDSGDVKTLTVSTRGTLRVKVECLEVSEHIYVLMVKMAAYIGKFLGPAGPWSYAVQHSRKTGFWTNDNMAILTNGDACTLVFQGSNDLSDFWSGADLRTENDCGYDLHIGFYKELVQMMRLPEWSHSFLPRLRQCSSVAVTGHSLGGAMATMFAGCANTNNAFNRGSPFPVPFRVSALYSVGAPAVATTQIQNGQTSTGCFEGARIFSEDSSSFDPVPYMYLPLVHPRVNAVQLGEHAHKAYGCTSDTARVGIPWGHSGGIFSVADHRSGSYLDRIGRRFPA